MLSLFPELLDWSWYVPFFFRVFLGAYLLCIAGMLIKKRELVKNNDALAFFMGGILLILLALSFLIGAFVQAVGAVGFALAMVALFLKRKHTQGTESVPFYLLIGFVSLSLVFLGPGPYSFDLPL